MFLGLLVDYVSIIVRVMWVLAVGCNGLADDVIREEVEAVLLGRGV
jgi:hypothetical protein